MHDAAQQLDTAIECRRHRDHAHSSLNRSRSTKGGFCHFRAFSIQTSPIHVAVSIWEVRMFVFDSELIVRLVTGTDGSNAVGGSP
jgi:hypothetical protein